MHGGAAMRRFARSAPALALAWSLSLLAARPAAAQSAPAEPAAPTALAPPAAPATEAVVAGVHIRLTGILHATTLVTQGVQSFDNATAVAPTSSLNPAVFATPDLPNLSFQVQQTRLGMILGEGSPLRGQVEIDFTHFDQSSPTVQAFPRIRIASLDWNFAGDHHLFIGQTWDIFGNAIGPQLLSHSFNLVGTLFRAGNIGFMRHQLGYHGRFGALDLAVATGLQGANVGPAFNNVEESLIPTGSVRVMAHLDERSVIGVSGLAAGLRFSKPDHPVQYRPAFGGELFADVSFGPLNLHAEAYMAQNLANMGALNLGYGRYGTDVVDAGGYLSARLTLPRTEAGEHSFTTMFGGASVLDPSRVVPGYTRTDPMAPLGTANPALGPGIVSNLSAHLAWWYSPLRGFSLVLEPYVYRTHFQLADTDAAKLAAHRTAFGGQLGAMYQF
jgi:hypothetical protein